MIAIMALIFFFSSQNATESGQVSNGVLVWIVEHVLHRSTIPEIGSMLIRKTAHFSIYFCLGASAALFVSECRTKRRAILRAWLIPVIYACTDELHQYFVPGRSCELRDVCIDSAGAFLGVVLIFLVLQKRQRNFK
jgi:VanZ family protein